MPELVTRITVFVASPGDVAAERKIAKEAVDHINDTELLGRAIVVQLKRWETHAWPGFGDDAQAVINHQIGPYDVFVGIMWNRIGTSTGRAVSGTAEEFDRAYAAWKEHKRPSLMFYFNRHPSDLASLDDLQQKSAVLQFKQKLHTLGALYWEYDGADEFHKVFPSHLINELRVHAGRQETAVVPAAMRSESFTEPDQWSQLLRIGSWTFDPMTKEIRGTGIYEFLLSSYAYGPRDYRIKTRLLFGNYRTYQDAGMDTANAGIVLGWQEQGKGRRYYNLLFSGRRMLLEAVGFTGADDYRDFKHFNEGVPFIIEDGRPYDIGISVTSLAIDVFVDNVLLYSVATPKDIEGRVGLRPWRSEITCSKFVAFES